MSSHSIENVIGIPEGTALDYIRRLESRIAKMEHALKEISEGKGRYSLDRLEHCSNTVEDMKLLALKALEE